MHAIAFFIRFSFLGNQLSLSTCGSEAEGKWLLTWHEDIRPISHGKKAQDARKECWDGTGLGNNIGFWECHTQDCYETPLIWAPLS